MPNFCYLLVLSYKNQYEEGRIFFLIRVPAKVSGRHKKTGKKIPNFSVYSVPIATMALKEESRELQDLNHMDVAKLHPLSPEIISQQATINIGTIGHVAHGKSTLVKAVSGVKTVRFKSELERNITIKLGYANAKIYQCQDKVPVTVLLQVLRQ